MSYIAFDLDALNRAPAVARAAGTSEETIIAGLARLWAWCFREKVDHATTDQLRGHFGIDCAAALVAFGFLEQAADKWRIRGAERYLRVAEQRKNAGKARATSAGRSAGRFTSDKPAKRQRRPAADQRPTSDEPALTPNTEHRTPLETLAPAPRAPRNEDLLCEDFLTSVGAKYAWQGAKDGAALKALLKLADIDEIRRRWRLGLKAVGWLNTRTVAQLNQKWNDLAGTVAVPVGSGDWRSREDHTQDFFGSDS